MNYIYDNPRIESFSRLKGNLSIKNTTNLWGSSARFLQIFLKGKILAIFSVNPTERTIPEEVIIVSLIIKVSEIQMDDEVIFQIQLQDRNIFVNSTSHPTNEDWIIALEYLRNYYAKDAEFHHMNKKEAIDNEIINKLSIELEMENWKKSVGHEMDFSMFIKAKNMKCFNELQLGVKNRLFIAQAVLQSRVLKLVSNKPITVG